VVFRVNAALIGVFKPAIKKLSRSCYPNLTLTCRFSRSSPPWILAARRFRGSGSESCWWGSGRRGVPRRWRSCCSLDQRSFSTKL